MSLKQLLFNVLEKTIGDYIVGFSADQLKLGLWSGKIRLHDLEVNTAAVQKLGLPIVVHGGRIESLELSIPWNRLGSSPVKIIINGVYVLLALDKGPGSLAPEELTEKLSTVLRAQLVRADAAFAKQLEKQLDTAQSATHDEHSAKRGIVARYAAKIVDNLEVSVRRVHARFEVEQSAVGVTLSAFEARAANEKWEVTFVERADDRHGSDKLLRNMVKLEGLALYWQLGVLMQSTDAGKGIAATTAGFRAVADKLDSLIAPHSPTAAKTLATAYILQPLDASLRLTRNDKDEPGLPRYRFDFKTSDNAQLAVRSTVMRAATALVKRIEILRRQHTLVKRHPAFLLRTAARPVTRANAKSWWQYAAEIACPALGTARNNRSAIDPVTIRRLRSRARYVELYTASLTSATAEDMLGTEEDAEMREIELAVPFEALNVWRQTVLLQRRDLAKKATAKTKTKSGSTAVPEAEAKPGFWGRVFGRGARRSEAEAVPGQAPTSDDATMEDLEAIARRVEEEEARAKPPAGFELIRAIVHTGCQVSLGDGQNTLSEFGVKLWAFARHTADGKELDLVASLGELYLRDATGLAARSGTLDTQNRLICHESHESNPDTFGSDFETCLAAGSTIVPELYKDDDANRAVDSGKAAIQLLLSRRPLNLGKEKKSRLNVITRARPIRIAYHAPVIARILNVFKPAPEDERALKKGAVEARTAAKTYARRAAANALEKLNDEGNGKRDAGQASSNFVFSLFVDAKLGAPTIVLPRKWYEADGAYIVDTGAIIVSGGIDARDARRQRWSASICEAKVARLDINMKMTSNIIAPFGVSVATLLSAPQNRAPPVALDIDFSPLSVSLAPKSLRELLELAALLSQGLQIDEHASKDEGESNLMINEGEVGEFAPETISDVSELPPAARAETTGSIAATNISFKLTARMPLVELKVSSNSGLAYVAKISSLQIDLAIRGAAGLTLRSTLKSISLYDERARFSMVESFSAADCVEAARAAVNARNQLPQKDETRDSSYAPSDDALLSFLMITELTQLPESQSTFSVTRISLSFSTLRAKCGAATLLPLKPLVEEFFNGLSAFSKSAPRSDNCEAHKQTVIAAGREAVTRNSSLNVVATIGEISAVLLNEAGELAVASASLYGVAALWSSSPETKSAAVRVAELRLDDACPPTESSHGVFTSVVVPKHAGGNKDGMLALVDYSDNNTHKNIEVLIRPVSIYVLPGPLYLALSAVRALVTSLGTVFSRDAEPIVPSENALSTHTDSASPPHEVTQLPRLLSVDVKLPEAEVILVRDASRRDSEALILQLGVHAAFGSETFENGQGGELALSISLENLSMMLAEDGLHNEAPPVHLLDPVGANISFERRIDNEGDPYHTMLSAKLSEIAARVSYRDVIMIIAMVCALMPPVTAEDEQTSAAALSRASQGSHATQTVQSSTKAIKVATLQASLTFSGARIFFVDDSQGTSVPFLNLAIGALEAEIDGPTTALGGSARCTFSATSFNRDCLTYEPLVRKFAVKVEINITRDLTTASSSQDIAITTEEIVEIICSGTFLTDLIHISSRLKNEASLAVRGSSKKLKATRDAPPLLVANETELILRCRVSGSDGPWLDLNPGVRLPVSVRSIGDKSVDSGSFLHSPHAVDIASQPGHSATPSFSLTGLVSGAPHRSVPYGFSSVPSLVDGISWHVGFDDVTGRVLAQFRSRVLASNRTPMPLELASVDSLDTATGTVVEPLSTKPLPIGLAQRGVVFKIRRHDPENQRNWSTSKSLTVWAKDVAGETSRGEHRGLGESRKKVVTLTGNVVPTQYVIFGCQRIPPPSSTASTSRDEAKIVLAPPLVVRSKLPCGFVLTLANSVAESRIRVGPGENVGCCDLDVSTDGVWLACRIANYRGKCETKLTTKNASKKALSGEAVGSNADFSVSTQGLFELILRREGTHPQSTGQRKQENVNDTLQLELRVEKKHRGLGLQLTLSCPLWIVDRTRLGLGFAVAPPPVMDKITRSIFCGDNETKAKRKLPGHTESNSLAETRQRVHTSPLGDFITIWVDSQRPHSLARPASKGETVYAEGEQVPYFFHSALPQPLDTAYRLVTYDAERCGPNNQPAIFNKIAQQHQQRMRRVGLESEAAKARRASRYITFRNDGSERLLDIYVAIDSRVERTPEWLLDGGAFARAAAISHVKIRRKKGPLSFRHDDDVRAYIVWHAEVFPESSVDLGPNDEHAMYLVFLALRDLPAKFSGQPDAAEPSGAALLSNDATSHNDAAAGDWLNSWPGAEWLGQFDATLLCSPDGGKFAINRQAKESTWSSRLTVGATSFPVSMEDGHIGILELDVRSSPLRGAFSNFGTLVEVGPRYALWNIDPDFQLYVRQKGQAESQFFLESGRENAIPWHWPKGKLSREIEFGCGVNGQVAWSIGAISIESVGGYALLTTHDDVIIRVEIALNNNIKLPPFESVVIYISVEREETALYVARNNASTSLDALFMQGSRLLAQVPAGQSRILGWANISGPRKLEVSLAGRNKTTVDVDAVRVETTLESTKYTVAVHVEEGTRFIDIGEGQQLKDPDISRAGLTERSISLKLAGIGISVVAVDAERIRREHVYARVNKADVLLRANGLADEFQLNVIGFQVDNHAPSALWPTFIAPSVRDSTEKALISLTAVRARHGNGATSLRYFAARVLPIDIHADFSSLNTLAAAITSIPLDVLNAEEALARARPAEWAHSMCVRGNRANSENVTSHSDYLTEARRYAHRPRGYVELLLLHPMEATISFEPTPVEEHEVGLSLLSYARTLATISNASIRLNSFIVERAIESPASLVSRVLRHYVFQILSQLLRIVGSLASIGSPINLVDSIGGGVKQFFYAPAAGIVESPQALATGVYKGTTGLVGGVVGGVTSSVAGIGNAVSTNLSMLSADREYVAGREARRRQFAAESGGATAGVIAGGTSIARGIAEGVGGIVLKPYEGAQKGGAIGAVKGFAQGIAGVAVKPAVGVLDGVGNVLQGVSQTASNVTIVPRIRPSLRLKQIPDSDHLQLAIDFCAPWEVKHKKAV